MELRKIAVIGGGASGCVAAIAAARAGCTVFLLEKNEKLGKKLYATGNGRCNLTNYHLDGDCYHSASDGTSRSRVPDLLDGFSRDDLIRFFGELGVPVHDRDGYVYPRTDQAETVVRALEKAIRNLGVRVLTGAAVREISHLRKKTGEDQFRILFEKSASDREIPVSTNGGPGKQRKKKRGVSPDRGPERRTTVSPEALECDAVILCTGGLAGPSFGCSGDGYRLAGTFSHHSTPLFPALTQLVCESPWLKRAAGVRCHASVCLIGHSGKVLSSSLEDGELQMTDYGVSGIPVFQISGLAARNLAAGQETCIRIDFLPEFTDERLEKEIGARLAENRDQMLSDLLLGLTHRKVIDFLLASQGLQGEMKARRLSDEEIAALIRKLRAFDLKVTGVRSYENAQVTCGGIPLEEISDRFESVFCPGLYLAGELLDVDGRCGGYNLQWAMSSGYQAGSAAGAPRSHSDC